MNHVIVVGGGAAGMMAAAAAAEAGARVTLFEKNEKLGKKLYITGKGRCNVTNACSRQDFLDHVVSNARFLYSAYDAWSNWDMADYLERQGLPLKTERGGRVFPVSDKSSDVIRTLQNAMNRAGVTWRLNTRVEALWLEDNPDVSREKAGPEEEIREAQPDGGRKKKKSPRREKHSLPEKICRGVILAGGRQVPADCVIVATGGLSYPSTGSTGDGYSWAEAAGHTLSERFPALVPFNAVIGQGIPCGSLQGLTLKNITMQIFDGGECLAGEFGELLFTHFGISGPVVLSASSRVTGRINRPDAPGELSVKIDLKPALSEEQLDRRFVRELEAGANKQMKNLLGAVYPARLVPVMLSLAGIRPEACGREITREERRRLLEMTKEFPLRLLGTRGFSEAVITQGGISVRETDPKTMESRRAAGLYFAGEVLDLDAFTGGYNLQIAWSTGHAAGAAAAGAGI